MGSGSSCDYSQETYDSCTLNIYERALQQTCVLPDVGLDLSLLKYSGLNSNAELQTYSNGLVNQVPQLVQTLGSGLGSLTRYPNAVGLGALVISIILDISMKRHTATADNSYSKFLQAFGEEKASAVRDTVSEYVRRHRLYLNDNRNLQGELQRLEKDLSKHLTTLRNSLLLDGQMRRRGFKIWQNGASFHVQMLIHEARLNKTTRISSKYYVHIIQAALTAYEHDLDQLLDKYKEQLLQTTRIAYKTNYCGGCLLGSLAICYLENLDQSCLLPFEGHDLCMRLPLSKYVPDQQNLPYPPIDNRDEIKLLDSYLNHLFSTYPPLTGLKSQFSNIANNLNIYINQHYSFTLPSARK